VAFGKDQLEELRSRADIVEVIGAHVRLRRAGNRYTGLCPFHNEKTPSFSVSPDRGFFYCFGCGVGGTVFNFVMRIEGLSFPEAVQSLARRYGVTLPERGPAGAKPDQRDAMYRANELASDFFAHVLWNTPHGAPAREYLKSRGVERDIAESFKLGFAPNLSAALAKALDKHGVIEAGRKVGLVKADAGGSHDMFRARLMFPIRDVQGRVIGFGGRVLDDRLPKYINSPESPLYSKARNVYGLYEARQAIAKGDRALVVEGYLDAIAVWAAGFQEVVASLGTALTVDQLRLLGRYTRNVIACFDGDAAGRKASLRALETFLHAGLLGRGIFIPSGFDPDTLIRDQGAAAFGKLVDSAELLAENFIREQASAARESQEGCVRAAQRVTEMLRMVANPFDLDVLTRKAAFAIGVREEVLRDEARNAQRGQRAASKELPPKLVRRDALAKAEAGLVAIALEHPELREQIAREAVTADFADASLAAALGEICSSNRSRGEIEALVAERLSEEQQGLLSEILMTEDKATAAVPVEEPHIPQLEEFWAKSDAKMRTPKTGNLERARTELVKYVEFIRKRRGSGAPAAKLTAALHGHPTNAAHSSESE
jgi:DNA primase